MQGITTLIALLTLLMVALPSTAETSIEPQAKSQEFASLVSAKFMYGLCGRSSSSDTNSFTSAVDFIKNEVDNPKLDAYSYGEFAYYADCNGRNAFEVNIKPGTLRFDHTDVSPLTIFMIHEMGALLNERGRTGIAPLEFVDSRIRIARSNGNSDMASAYARIKARIEFQIKSITNL